MSGTKIEERATCPYCGDTSWYKFHFGMAYLYCHKCEKKFAIHLETKIVVESKKIIEMELVDGEYVEV